MGCVPLVLCIVKWCGGRIWGCKRLERVAVIGLGYVGLPLAVAFAEAFPTVGFDIDERRLAELREGNDRTLEVEPEVLRRSSLVLTSDPEALKGVTMFVVAVPTPVDANHAPDLGPLCRASEIVGSAIGRGAIAVFESTVFPGATEEVCGPIIERVSGLRRPQDFTLAYSPERANPGDRSHGLRQIVKVVAGEDDATLARVADAYGRIVPAGLHRAPNIKVAEAAKVIENTQRDLNIALMNELAMIFERLGIRTRDVLAAAGTKWNFLPFTPGLVGGHCIGVDPYYLTARAEAAGYHPEIILAGRRINDGMGAFIAQKVATEFVRAGLPATWLGRHPRPHLQGERARPAQQPRARYRQGTRQVRYRATGARSDRRHRPATAKPASPPHRSRIFVTFTA